MLLRGAVVALVTVGLVVPCLIDAARMPRHEFGWLSRRAWLALIVVLWPLGAIAWLLVGRPRRGRREPLAYGHLGRPPRLSAQEALRRHPASQSVEFSYDALLAEAEADAAAGRARLAPTGPDDDQQFLTELGRAIREAREREEG
jgi:phospholipase D-like protein